MVKFNAGSVALENPGKGKNLSLELEFPFQKRDRVDFINIVFFRKRVTRQANIIERNFSLIREYYTY